MKSKKPNISILIPVYGVEKYITRCFMSLINQNYSNIEIIFVNDCTPDNSITILHNLINLYPKYKNQIHILNHTTNKGLAAARKTALLSATGEFVMHVDSDDWLEPNIIDQLVSMALEKKADMVIGDYFHTYSNYKQRIHYTIPDSPQIYAQELACRNKTFPVSIWNRLIRREVHLKALPIEGLDFGEDYVTVPRIISNCTTIIKINIPTYNYWQENTTSYVKNFSMKSFNNLKLATDILCDFFSADNNKLNGNITQTIKLKNKIILLQLGCPKYGHQVWKLWPNINNISSLTTFEKIIWHLGHWHLYNIIYLILKYGAYLKYSLHKFMKNKYECCIK